MQTGKIIALAVPVAIVVAGLAAYVGLIADGALPPPDPEAMANFVAPLATGSVAMAIGVAAIAVVACTVAAPLLFALRSGDRLAILVSFVLTVAMIGVFMGGKTVVQEILGALIYIANIILSTVVYAVHRVENRA